MNTIDRYLLRQFLKSLLICFLSLTGLYVVFDAFSNIDEFVRSGEEAGGMMGVLAGYYSCRIVWFFDRTCALLVLIAAMFTVAWIQRHNELTALMAAGISRARVVRPIFLAAIGVIALAAFNREWLIPKLGNTLVRTPQTLRVKEETLQPQFDNQTEIFIQGKTADREAMQIHTPRFQLPATLSAAGSELAAACAYYRPPEGDRPGGYLLEQVTEPGNLASLPTLRLDGRPVIYMPKDTPWLKPGECFVASGVSLDDLLGGAVFRQYGSIRTLIRGIRNPSLSFGAEVRVAIHARIVQPLLELNLLVLGLPLVLSRQSRNVFTAMGMSLGLVTFFFVVILGFQYLGNNSLLPASVSAWGPLVVFVPWAAALSDGIWE